MGRFRGGAHPSGNILQTTNWARLKNRFGWSSERVWMRRNGRLVGGAQILYRSVGLGIIKLGYIPHGPLVDWHDPERELRVLFAQSCGPVGPWEPGW
ncbi:MAG: peptidoglycan bridge formation glycyltransferase FemA/FemB family protein [Chloroflexota bacterium]